jgi:hypothetical protein
MITWMSRGDTFALLKLSTCLSRCVICTMGHPTDSFVRQKQLYTAYQAHVLLSCSARHHVFASWDHQHPAFEVHFTFTIIGTVTVIAHASARDLPCPRVLISTSPTNLDLNTSNATPTKCLSVSMSRLNIHSKKRSAPQAEDGGRAKKSRAGNELEA